MFVLYWQKFHIKMSTYDFRAYLHVLFKVIGYSQSKIPQSTLQSYFYLFQLNRHSEHKHLTGINQCYSKCCFHST